MGFGAVGETMTVAAVPAVGARNIGTEAALVEVPALELILSLQHATNSHVQVLRIQFSMRQSHIHKRIFIFVCGVCVSGSYNSF